MSKGNFLLSQARGKVGDIVFTRLDGEQVARAYNAHPKYSNTIAQATNRMNLATISQAYSAFKGIADHSFEGKSFGMQSMKAFMSENIKLVQGGQGAYLFRNGRGVAPNALTIAKGSIDISSIKVKPYADDANVLAIGVKWAEGSTLDDYTVEEILPMLNAKKGDEICLVYLTPSVINNYKVSEEITIQQKAYLVNYCRFTVKIDAEDTALMFQQIEGEEGLWTLNPVVLSSAENIGNLKIKKVSDGEGNFICFSGFYKEPAQDGECGATFVVSRKEGSAWLRSTSVLNWGEIFVPENFGYATALSSYSPEGIKYLNHTEG